MIAKYRFGTPLETGAVVTPLPESPLPMDCFTVTSDPLTLSCPLVEGAAVYGLGENVRGINKRGWHYESQCTDCPHHSEDKLSLYGAHNFLIVSGPEEVFGLFVDDPGVVRFDVGYTRSDLLTITVQSGDAWVYLIRGETEIDVARQFRALVGRSYIPPKWAFGYGQSRWGYRSEEDIRAVAEGYRSHGMALDMIYLDIDYMERLKDFTVNQDAFPDLKALAADLKRDGIRLVPIIDAGVKIETGYDVYEEGVEKGCFCTDERGENFIAAVWPGQVHFPDVLNPAVRRWFGQLYGRLTEQGIEGFWNDMNEPAIFYTQKNLDAAFARVEDFKGKNLDLNRYGELQGLFNHLGDAANSYHQFFHQMEQDGKLVRVRHDRVHNLYGMNMTRAASEAFDELAPGKRLLLFSRASYVGAHRYGGIWQGDNKSWWSHLQMNVQMMPSLNLLGFLYTGADLGGFGCDATEDLLLRWIAFGIFTPLMRNHSALGTREQELYRYPRWETFRDLLSLRYMLLPYLYSEYMKAALTDGLLFRPLAFDYRKDARAREVEDQLLLGESVMLAPVCRQNATGRYVYLPEEMKLLRLKRAGDWTEEILPAGDHYIPVALDEVPLFLRPDRLVPIAAGEADCVMREDFTQLSLLSFVKTGAEYLLYDDDGESRDYNSQSHYTAIRLDERGALTVAGSQTVTLPGER